MLFLGILSIQCKIRCDRPSDTRRSIGRFQRLKQCFPNCVPRHTGVPLKRLKCAAKVLCFHKTLCCKYFWSALHCFGF